MRLRAALAPPLIPRSGTPDATRVDAVNGRDSDADPWAADAEMTAPGAQVSGRDKVIGFIGVFQEAFRTSASRSSNSSPMAQPRRLKASSVAPMMVCCQARTAIAPTGRAVALPWGAVYVTDGEALKSEHLFFDQMDFLGQLGLLPG